MLTNELGSGFQRRYDVCENERPLIIREDRVGGRARVNSAGEDRSNFVQIRRLHGSKHLKIIHNAFVILNQWRD